MLSNMWQQGAQSLTLILLLSVICARCATPMPTTMPQEQELTTTEMVLEKESHPESKRIDCKLTFDATMGSLEQQKLLQANGCNVPHTSNTNKPTDVEQQQVEEAVLRHSMSGGSSQPLYELQLVVWPADIEDVAVTTTPRTTTTTLPTTPPTTTPPTTTTTARTTTSEATTQTPSEFPLYEDQLVVFPQMDFQEENFDYFFDELETAATSTTTRPRPTTSAQPSQPVYVVENYRKKHPNGTEEHKLILSNGLVNYMKLYGKRVDNKLINVQEGYSSVPVAGVVPQIQTLHYIADERGYNIYKIERSPLPSLLPNRVHHKATKVPAIKPHM
ncbi:probable splicing factor 3A subunit 1 [Drosophila innubila]|uniref:probable splicing factor 3A subunit 1 n=1 Tax=Drosophila innubila TaxID=198719 RepID=UPI00148D3932|nr:probable splicing factor 3A subunit 1 [Drosophila innubila]